ncbi:hypothetical protein PbJCM13498_28090 [Prolixibacter bellariivorans]|uniref:Uncharacterized protein n=1 Tax=Prolixibacter bellariivorans TaxID=314319 RepID=A0A5M4B228_9BACT|nr:hypothetical protein PbJCM13498_28090 [Prolixibacter bellariivorans]
MKIRLRPSKSDNFPKGTRKMADVNKYDMIVQLSFTAFMESSVPMAGKAMLIAEDKNDDIKEVKPTA